MALKPATDESNANRSDFNLITAVLSNSQLRARLAAMPSDEKTIVPSSNETPSQLAHPAWKSIEQEGFHSARETPPSADLETIALPNLKSAPLECEDLGFLPMRRVAMIGDGKPCEA